MKLNQYCSVCKKHLDMDVIPTDDGGDDGVIWLRCPECQGFLPKFTGDDPGAPATSDAPATTSEDVGPASSPTDPTTLEPDLEAIVLDDDDDVDDDEDLLVDDDLEEPAPARRTRRGDRDAAPAAPAEPLAEYAAQLAEADLARAIPYRPGQHYEVGDVIHHLAYDDIGVVVAKEDLAGGRKVAKTYFEKVGVIRLIEQAPGNH